jgi:hypothetical protein
MTYCGDEVRGDAESEPPITDELDLDLVLDPLHGAVGEPQLVPSQDAFMS